MKRKYARYRGRDYAKASEYLEHLENAVSPKRTKRVALLARVSRSWQVDHLGPQAENLRRGALRLGFEVFDIFLIVGNGSDYFHSAAFQSYAERCRAAGVDFLAAESTCRFLRHPDFSPRDSQPLEPLQEQFEEYLRVVKIPLATLWHPDLGWKKVREMEGWRAITEQKKTAIRNKTILLMFVNGVSYQQIGQAVGLTNAGIDNVLSRVWNINPPRRPIGRRCVPIIVNKHKIHYY